MTEQQRPAPRPEQADPERQAGAGQQPDPTVAGNPDKDPDRWVTGDERMTGPQASYLQTLAQEAGEEYDPSLSKADASKEIDRLQEVTGRGTGG